jgi:ArsR family transcriptional regulator, arsenate/arsenite/antimonite-responsive transcriptional repressor
MPVTQNPAPAKASKKLSTPRRTAILKALADPKRFQLLEKIAKARCPLGCTEALAALAIAPATLSHHVKELESAGLIHAQRQGKFVYLSLNSEVWSALAASLAALAPANCGPASRPNF